MKSEIGPIMDSLNDLLEAEKAALLAGDLERLTGMAERKEALIEALNSAEQADFELLKELDLKVKRNQGLLNSALDGIRTVARRMAAFRRVRGSLETYDAKGEKSIIEVDPETSFEKRASRLNKMIDIRSGRIRALLSQKVTCWRCIRGRMAHHQVH